MMKNDGLCWVHVPTDLTDPTLSSDVAQIVNGLRALYGLTALSAGDENPYYAQISRIGIASGAAIEITNGTAACGPIGAVDRVPLSLVDSVLIAGGDVEGLPAFIRITDLAEVVPSPLGDGTETWATWGTIGDSHVPQQIGNAWYRTTDVGASGRKLNASEWAPIRERIVSIREFKEEILPSPELP